MLGSLKRRDAVDVNQRAMHRPVSFRVNDDDAVLAECDVFGVANLMHFAVRQPNLERLERGALQPFSNHFHVHAIKCITRKTP